MLEEVLYIPNRNRYERISKKEIQYLEAQGAYVDIFLTNNIKHRVSTNLQQFIAQIPDKNFFKVSRKHIVNLTQITALGGSKVWIGDVEIKISRKHKSQIEKFLPIIKTKLINNSKDTERGNYTSKVESNL